VYLGQHREQLSRALLRYTPAPQSLLDLTDAFLATACLQKALRRADRAYAHGAARALLAIDPPRLWRRLVIVACEDFGLSDLVLTAQIIAAASNGAWRKLSGGDEFILSYLIDRLLGCPRDRRVDELYMMGVMLSRFGNSDTALQQLGASQNVTEILRQAVTLVLRCEVLVPYKGVRSVLAKECDAALARMVHRGWADHGLLETCMQGRRTSQCLLPVLLPLLKAATEHAGGQTSIVTRTAPETRDINGIPSYAIDGYTRPGRVALLTLSRHDRRLAKLLSPLPTAKARMDALVNLLFVVEGGVCTQELSDQLYEELKSFSLGCWTGLPAASLAEGLAIMADAIPALNDIRETVSGDLPLFSKLEV
jgi:hypothetical protein